MTTRVDAFPMAFALIPDAAVTRRMLSLSTSREKEEAPIVEGQRMLEVWTPVNTLFLDYPLLTPQEARDVIADAAADSVVDLPWWRRIFS